MFVADAGLRVIQGDEMLERSSISFFACRSCCFFARRKRWLIFLQRLLRRSLYRQQQAHSQRYQVEILRLHLSVVCERSQPFTMHR